MRKFLYIFLTFNCFHVRSSDRHCVIREKFLDCGHIPWQLKRRAIAWHYNFVINIFFSTDFVYF